MHACMTKQQEKQQMDKYSTCINMLMNNISYKVMILLKHSISNNGQERGTVRESKYFMKNLDTSSLQNSCTSYAYD